MKRILHRFCKEEDGGAVMEWLLLVMFVTTFSFYTSPSTMHGAERYAQNLAKGFLGANGPFMGK